MVQVKARSVVTAKVGVEVDYPGGGGGFTYCGLASLQTCPGQVKTMHFVLLAIKARRGTVYQDQRVIVGTHFYKGVRLALPGSKDDHDLARRYAGLKQLPSYLYLPALGPNNDTHCFEIVSFNETELQGEWSER